MNPIVCPDNGCAETLVAAKSSICNPEVRRGEVSRLFIGLRGAPFTPVVTPVISTSVNNPVAWSTRIGTNDASGTDPIVVLHVLGDKPRPEAEEVDLSLGRKKTTKKNHQVNFVSDEFNTTNHTFFRTLECGGTFDMWYETSDGLLFGSHEGPHIGIQVSFGVGMVVPRERAGVITWEGEAKWESLKTETYIESPVPDAPEPGA